MIVSHLMGDTKDENGALHGIAFAAFRDQGVFDFYTAVHPRDRRQGLGRALAEAAVSSGAVLRARVRDDAKAVVQEKQHLRVPVIG